MLIEHPFVERARIDQAFTGHGTVKRLIVETNINLSDHRTPSDQQKLHELENYLRFLARHDYGDFSEVEIRPFAEDSELESDYKREYAA